MSLPSNLSDKAVRKLRFYEAALYLFAEGKSHPQIVNILQEYEPNNELLVEIVDKAMHEEWDKLNKEARILFSEGLNYEKVLAIISTKEADREIVKLICDDWYNLKTQLADSVVEGSTNRFEGMKWIIICTIAIPIFFYIGSSWIVKVIWIIALVGSILQWIVGFQQKNIESRIQQIFSADITRETINEEK